MFTLAVSYPPTNITVQRQAIALVLGDLLRTLDDRLGFLRPRTVIGYGLQSDPAYYVRTIHLR